MGIGVTYDVAFIKRVMFELWPEVTEDRSYPEYYEPNLQTTIWLRIGDHGLVALDKVGQAMLRVHPMVRHKCRKQGRSIIKAALRWYLNNAAAVRPKLIAEVPEPYRHVRLFCRQCGFSPEGVRTAAYLRGGKLWDVHMYGATADEVERWVVGAGRTAAHNGRR